MADALAFAPPRPEVYRTKEFAAFKVTEDNRTYPARLDGVPGTLEEAVNIALRSQLYCHKDKLIIRETEDGATVLHVFAIRRRAPKWVHPAGEILPRRVVDHYADPVCSFDGGVVL